MSLLSASPTLVGRRKQRKQPLSGRKRGKMDELERGDLCPDCQEQGQFDDRDRRNRWVYLEYYSCLDSTCGATWTAVYGLQEIIPDEQALLAGDN